MLGGPVGAKLGRHSMIFVSINMHLLNINHTGPQVTIPCDFHQHHHCGYSPRDLLPTPWSCSDEQGLSLFHLWASWLFSNLGRGDPGPVGLLTPGAGLKALVNAGSCPSLTVLDFQKPLGLVSSSRWAKLLTTAGAVGWSLPLWLPGTSPCWRWRTGPGRRSHG